MSYKNVPEANLRGIRMNRLRGRLDKRVRSNLSYREGIHIGQYGDLGDQWLTSGIDVPDLIVGRTQGLAIISTEEADVKTICSLPDESFCAGELFYWSDNYWLIMERDADTEVYTRGTAQRCNHLLKWLTKEREPKYSPCVIVDSTKYTAGETYTEMVTMGNTRVALYMPRNEDSMAIERDRRFVLGQGANCLAYKLTKPDAVSLVDPLDGVMMFTLSEDSLTANDSQVYGVADYYIDRSAPGINSGVPPKAPEDNTSKGVWL